MLNLELVLLATMIAALVVQCKWHKIEQKIMHLVRLTDVEFRTGTISNNGSSISHTKVNGMKLHE
jgi:hypothetical protein